MAALENRPAPFPAIVRPPTRADYSERDIEPEITLNCLASTTRRAGQAA
ncbi:hypothetical protein [Actinomadura pelletieri]|nr:hypothetical protein [Actinomadura pelletieri]